MNSSRDIILQNIRTALKTPSHLPDDPPDLDKTIRDKLASKTPDSLEGLIEQFKQEFGTVSGEFFRVSSSAAAVHRIVNILRHDHERTLTVGGAGYAAHTLQQLPPEFVVIDPQTLSGDERKTKLAGITTAVVDVSYAVTDSATLVVPFNRATSTLPHFLPDCVIALVRKNQLVANHFELFDKLEPEAARNMLLITGPSRTADIEKILILGAHGPRRLVVILIDE